MTTLQIINIVVSVLMLVMAVIAVLKKVEIRFALLGISVIGIVYYTVTNGSILGDGGIGSSFLDMFEYIVSIISSQMSGNILLLMIVIAYVTYMEHLKATKLLCTLLAKPLKKVKRPYLVLSAIVIITAILKWAIQSAMGQAALVIATFYPILVSLGFTAPTAATAIMFAVAIIWGPGNGINVMMFGFAESSMPLADYFAKYELVNVPVSAVLALVVMYFTSKYFDKKENLSVGSGAEESTLDEVFDIPKWYCVLPFLPVVLIVVFSSLVVKNIVISISAANLLSFIFVLVLELIRNRKNLREAIQGSTYFWKGCSEMMLSTGGLILCASLFSSVLNKIGGIAYLFRLLLPSEADASSLSLLVIVGSLAAAVFSAVTGSCVGCTTLFGALFAGIASSVGISVHIVTKTLIPVLSIGYAFSPIAAGNLYISKMTGVDITVLIKRLFLPVLTYMLSSIIITQFILVG